MPAPRTWTTLVALATLSTLAACTSSAQPQTRETTHANVGKACVQPGGAGAAHAVEVDFGVCMSSSCDGLVGSSCTAKLDGKVLTIESTATVSSQSGPDVICSSDCRSVAARCETPGLAAGSYSVVYGGQRAELTVPSANAACVERGAGAPAG